MPAFAVRPEVQQLQPKLVEWRRHLHAYPELGLETRATAAYVTGLLASFGYQPQAVLQTGVVALVEGQPGGPVLAVRADMDALPIQEANDVPYRSRIDGVMHACGHDGHTAIALGAAAYLAQHRDAFAGSVKFLFQPGEEGPGGAKPMIEAGVLAAPTVERIIGLHIASGMPSGWVAVHDGPSSTGLDEFTIAVHGPGGHSSSPHHTVDTVAVAAEIITALQAIPARLIDPQEEVAVVVCTLQGASARNVIPATVTLGGTVRYLDPAVGKLVQAKMQQLVAGICAAYGATYDLDYQTTYPAVVNDPAVTAIVRQVVTEVVGAERMLNMGMRASDDMGFFLQAVPGAYFYLGGGHPEGPNHTPRFDFDEAVLGLGVELLVRCVEALCQRG